MTMEAGVAQLMHVYRHYMNAAIQVNLAYNNEQAKLALEHVLSPIRLQSAEGTAESLATLDQLRMLTDAHKTAFGQYIIAMSRDVDNALAQLPHPQRDEQRHGTVASLNRQLALQSDFYTNRVRWIDAAAALCNLIQTRRATTSFTVDGIVFQDDEDFERFNELLASIDEIHHIEVAAVEERMAGIQRAMAVLSL